ncbi:MAG: metallophosphoesterase [Candidatus Aminicenantes bacterium]|nr:metallophosphoesterase [Candidatus Aminicenantes bacterium]
MKLYAISDLHLANKVNRLALETLPTHPDDWLILGGDVGESEIHLHFALTVLTRRFKRLLWVPGNHDLWTIPIKRNDLRGEAKYNKMVSICRHYGVLTPEDPYVLWPGEEKNYLLAPLFALYDYSFCPENIKSENAVQWAVESGVICTDEELLLPEPYHSIPAWCKERCRYTEKRLKNVSPDVSLVLINHYPLVQDLIRFHMFPRFSIWCGTRRTADWHTRFNVSTVVYGHLHQRASNVRDGVRFEEVSLGYPRDWNHDLGIGYYLRQILPVPPDKKNE